MDCGDLKNRCHRGFSELNMLMKYISCVALANESSGNLYLNCKCLDERLPPIQSNIPL